MLKFCLCKITNFAMFTVTEVFESLFSQSLYASMELEWVITRKSVGIFICLTRNVLNILALQPVSNTYCRILVLRFFGNDVEYRGRFRYADLFTIFRESAAFPEVRFFGYAMTHFRFRTEALVVHTRIRNRVKFWHTKVWIFSQ